MIDSELPFVPFYPRDFAGGTIGWRLLERGLYTALLFAQWELGDLPADWEELALIAGATPSEFASAWPRVSKKFEPIASGRLLNRRLEAHRAKAMKIRDIRAIVGRKGGKASGEVRQKVEANSEAKQGDLLPVLLEKNPSKNEPSSELQNFRTSELQNSTIQPLSGKPDLVGQIFDHWRETWSHPRAGLDAKRRATINRALKVYTPEQLRTAISGYRNSPHHTGQNDRNTVYDDIGLMLRDAAHIDAGIRFAETPPDLSSPTTQHNVAVLQNWKAPEDDDDASDRRHQISSNTRQLR